MVLIVFCPKRRRVPRLDEFFMQGMPGVEHAMQHCLVVNMLFSKHVKILWQRKYIIHTHGYHFLLKLQAGYFVGQMCITVHVVL